MSTMRSQDSLMSHQRTTTHVYNEVTRLTTDVIRGPLVTHVYMCSGPLRHH